MVSAINRSQTCPVMQVMNEKKPRSTIIAGTTAPDTTQISVSFDPLTGQVIFGPDMIDTRVETHYERAKGPKFVHRIPLEQSLLKVDPNDGLAANFDIIFAVDTNTRNFKGFRFSVTGVIEAKHTVDPQTRLPALFFHTPFLLEFMQVASQPEQLGWLVALNNIQADPQYNSFTRIGLIVDSDLQNLRRYNDRKLAIFENSFLPDRFTLIYASADVGGEYLANQFIRAADKTASQVLDLLERGVIPINEKRIEAAPFAAFRRINPKPPERNY